MSDHSTALVPLWAWCFSAPDLADRGQRTDVGLLAESLLYYDRVALIVPDFAGLLRWLIEQGALSDFLALTREGTILIYDYAFFTAAFYPGPGDSAFSVLDFQDPLMERPGTFEERVLYHADVEKVLPKGRIRKKLYEALRGKVIEVKAHQFGPALENARHDFKDGSRNALMMQAFLDELYPLRGLGNPPIVRASVGDGPSGVGTYWNLDFEEIKRIGGERLGFHTGMPFVAAATANRFLWSAAQQSWDLYLASPMSTLVGDKMQECERGLAISNLISSLQTEVRFPDVRSLVNDNRIRFADVLDFRKKALPFRRWLQAQGERDHGALVAYHNEVANEAGWTTGGRRVLALFGAVGGQVVSSEIRGQLGTPTGAAVGAAAGVALTYVTAIASRFREGWKPVVFGRWLGARIRRLLDESVR